MKNGKNGRHRVMVELDAENFEQLQQLKQVYHASSSSIMRQALVRWYHSETLIVKAAKRRHLPAGSSRARR